MATNNRDVKMTLSVETLGAEEIKKLGTSIEQLAKEGGDAAPEFERLAQEVAKLGEQAKTMASFQALSDATAELTAKQATAAESAERLRLNLETARQATQGAATAQQTAAAAYTDAQKRLSEIAGALATLRASYDAAGKKTSEYKDAVKALITEKTELQKKTVDLRNERNDANTVLAKTVGEETKAQKQYDRSATSLQALAKQVVETQKAQSAAASELERLGLSSSDVAKSQAQLTTALNATGEAARSIKSGIDAAAQSEREMTQQAELAAQRIKERTEFTRRSYEIEQQITQQRIADEQRRAAAEQAAAASAIAAKRAEQAESDRLFEIQRQTREKMERAARVQLAAELAAQREAAALTIQIENQKRAALEASAKAQADAISNSFKTVGARGATELRAEIDRIRAAMNVLSSQAGLTGRELQAAMTAGNTRIKELERDIRAATGELTLADRAANLFKNSMGQIAAGNLIADGLASIVEKVKELGRQFVAVNLQADTMRRALNAIYKDSDVTAAQFDFLRSTASSAGVSIAALGTDFVRFSAATQASGIPLKQTNELFAALTAASSTLGLGADKTSLALNALGQMASKGVVSMEELRQQLGDSVPGALTLTAKGFGITDAQLVKLVESGQLAARDFFPAFTEGLKTLSGETDGVRQSWERFKNMLTITAQNAGDAGWMTVMQGALKLLGGTVASLTFVLGTLSEGLFAAGRAAIVFFESIRGNGSQALAWFNEETDKMNKRLAESAKALDLMLDPSEANKAALRQLAAETSGLTQATQATAAALQVNRQELANNERAANGSAAGHKALEIATKISGDSALSASSKWVQLNLKLGELVKAQQDAVSVSEKLAKAAETEAESIVAVAKLRGDEATLVAAEAEAADVKFAALKRVAEARRGEADATAVQLAAVLKLSDAEAGGAAARKQAIEDLAKKEQVARAEAEAAKNAADASRIEREERQLAAVTYRDNSAALNELREAMRAATATAQVMRQAEKDGLASKEDVRAATEAAAGAVARYNDAVEDSVKKLDLQSRAKDAEYKLLVSGLELQKAEYESILKIAQANGDEQRATYAKIELKKLEIQIIEATVKADQIRQEAVIAGLKLQMQELDLADPLYAQKKKELEIKLKLADAEILVVKARGASVEFLQKEVNSLRENTGATEANQKASGRAADAKFKESDARAQNAQSLSEENDKLAEQNGLLKAGASQYYNKAGYASNPDGSVISAQIPSWMSLFNYAKSLGISEQQASDIADQGFDKQGNYKEQLQRTQMRSSYDSIDMYEAARRAAEKIIREQPIAQAQPAAQTQARESSSGTAVVININGASRRINVASQSDASALASLLAELESSSSRSY